MRRRARGIAGLVLLSLGLGVVTTYGVAWWFLNRPVPPTMTLLNGGDASCSWMVIDLGGRDEAIQISSVPGKGNGVDFELHEGVIGELPSWSVIRQATPGEVAAAGGMRLSVFSMLEERGAGWPWIAVVCREAVFGAIHKRIPGRDLTAHWRTGSKAGDEILLAAMPVWPGFAFCVALYGGVWGAMLAAVRAILRLIRGRSWRCASCRYDLRGLNGTVCPECGEWAPPPHLRKAVWRCRRRRRVGWIGAGVTVAMVVLFGLALFKEWRCSGRAFGYIAQAKLTRSRIQVAVLRTSFDGTLEDARVVLKWMAWLNPAPMWRPGLQIGSKSFRASTPVWFGFAAGGAAAAWGLWGLGHRCGRCGEGLGESRVCPECGCAVKGSE